MAAYDSQPMRMYRGEDMAVTLSPDVLPTDDVTAWAVSWLAWNKRDGSPASPEVAKASGAGVAVLSAVAKTFRVTIDSADTAVLAAGAYGWEFWRTDAGSRKLLAAGNLDLVRAKKTY